MLDDTARLRDRRLRRTLLDHVRLSALYAPTGRVNGRMLAEATDGNNADYDRYESDAHALQLVRELVAKGYLDERVGEVRRGEVFGLRHATYGITQAGRDLLNEASPADRDVWDDRLSGEELDA